MTTEHALDFEVAPWVPLIGMPAAEEYSKFRVGTCEGLWRSTKTSYDILAITNNVPGNGHFNDVLQWFEASCKRDKKDFVIQELWNKDLKEHLLKKRGFKVLKGDDVIKKLKHIK